MLVERGLYLVKPIRTNELISEYRDTAPKDSEAAVTRRMITLVDTSVWIDHLSRGNSRLVRLLDEGIVCCHRFVVGEIACGALQHREEVVSLLQALPEALIAEHDEVLTLVADRKLAGRGLGWVDRHLLAAALLTRCQLWTLDKALAAAADELQLTSSSRTG